MNNNTSHPLIDETLTRSEVIELINVSHDYSAQTCVSAYYGTFTSWDGTSHHGCIVTMWERNANACYKYYFMEITEEYSYSSDDTRKHYYNHVFHKLMPISGNHTNSTSKKKITLNGEYSTKELCDILIKSATIDTWEYTKIHKNRWDSGELIPLTLEDLKTFSHDYNTKENREADMREKELIKRFVENTPCAEDPLWYEIHNTIIENKIINALRKAGHCVIKSGEKDSFGWVTRWLELDGKLMYCI